MVFNIVTIQLQFNFPIKMISYIKHSPTEFKHDGISSLQNKLTRRGKDEEKYGNEQDNIKCPIQMFVLQFRQIHVSGPINSDT